MPATPNIIDQLGISWTLHVDTIATLYYDHPVFGYLEYTGVEGVPWLCDNTNTLYLTSQGTGEAALPDGVLPKSVCIRPKFSGECGDYDKNTYNPPADKCLCKDIECDFYLPLFLTCDGVTDNCIGHFVKGTDATECEASGPTYTAQCPLNDVLMEVRIYCKAGTWMADIYNDGTLCDSCVELTIEACPFRITGSYTAATCSNDCVPCIGEGCEPPPPPEVQTDCCENTIPETLHISITGCVSYSGTLTLTSDVPGETIWSYTDDTSRTWDLVCRDGSWEVNNAACFFTASNTSEDCDPLELHFSGTMDTGCYGGCSPGSVTIVVTL